MSFTRSDLRNLFIEQKEIDRNIRITKIVDYMKDLVIKSAKQGEFMCKENFDNSINELLCDVLKQLTNLFPDSSIETGNEEYFVSYPKRVYISINWCE